MIMYISQPSMLNLMIKIDDRRFPGWWSPSEMEENIDGKYVAVS